jgi:GxxExxY protein
MAIWTLIKTFLATILANQEAAGPTPPPPEPTPPPPEPEIEPATTYTAVLTGISQQVATCATTVSTTLGPGLPEVIYENALAHELRRAGLHVAQQHDVAVYYEGMVVGDYTADLLVEETVLVKLKAINCADAFDTAQCTNYLKATGLACTVLLNFGTPTLNINSVVNVA